MFTHPHLSSQIASYRHRDMLASAQQHRLARQLRAQARASRPARRAQRLRRSEVIQACVSRVAQSSQT